MMGNTEIATNSLKQQILITFNYYDLHQDLNYTRTYEVFFASD